MLARSAQARYKYYALYGIARDLRLNNYDY